jgi:hypothetical protein
MLTMPSKESWWILDHLEHWRRATEGALFTMSTFIMHNFDKLLVALHRTLFCIFQILSVYVMILHVNVCVCARTVNCIFNGNPSDMSFPFVLSDSFQGIS